MYVLAADVVKRVRACLLACVLLLILYPSVACALPGAETLTTGPGTDAPTQGDPSTTEPTELLSAGDPGHVDEGDSQEVYNVSAADIVLAPASGLSASYDARTQGLISPVRLQDPWGACWAFGMLSAMEANLVKQGLAVQGVQLSPRHLTYFAGTPVGSEAGRQAGEGQYPIDALIDEYGTNAAFALGGHALEAASAISSGEGVVFDADYPYRNDEGYLASTDLSYAATGTWALDESARYDAAFALRNMHRISNPGVFEEPGNVNSFVLDYLALDAVKQAIVDYGAVSVSFCSYDGTGGNPDYYDEINHSFFTNETTVIDHDVCIVGWDDNFARENFTTGKGATIPEGDGAWIVKNSWGAASQEFPNRNDWGEEGYFYLSYYDRSVQGFTAWDMMSLETSIINQHDYMGQRSNAETRVADYEPVSYANVFTAQEKQALSAISVNTYAPGTEVSYALYLLDSDALKTSPDPTQGTLLERGTHTFDWGGYHRIELANTHVVGAGERFAVVISMLEEVNGVRIPVASIEAGNNPDMLRRFGLSHYDTVICNEGETCVLATIDGVQAWVDGVRFASLIHELANDNAFYGNACIKVFANPVVDPEPPAPQPTPAPVKVTTHAAPAQAQAAPVNTYAHATAATADRAQGAILVLAVLVFFSGCSGIAVLCCVGTRVCRGRR